MGLTARISFLLLAALLASAAVLCTEGVALSVPAVPNESVVTGQVKGYAIVSSSLVGVEPEQVLYSVTVLVESSEAAGGMPDFLSIKKGRNLTFYTKEELSPELFGRRIRATARYAGDERGGLLWIREIQTID